MRTNVLTFGRIGKYAIIKFGGPDEGDKLELILTPDNKYSMFVPVETYELPKEMDEYEFYKYISEHSDELREKFDDFMRRNGLEPWPMEE